MATRFKRSRHDDIPHENPDVPVVPAELVEVVEDDDPAAALDLLERQHSEIRVEANAAVRRMLTAPTPEELQKLKPLPPELQPFLSPLTYTPESMRVVIGSLFFFSDLFVQTVTRIRNIVKQPITVRRGPPLPPDRLLNLRTDTVEVPARRLHVRGSSKTVLIPAQRSTSERDFETADDKAMTDISRAALKLMTDLLGTVPHPRDLKLRVREDERVFLQVTDMVKAEHITQAGAIRRIAKPGEEDALLQRLVRVKGRSKKTSEKPLSRN